MPLGVIVTTSTAPPSRGTSTLSDTLFLAGPATTGPTVPTLLRSIGDFAAIFGARITGNAKSYDYLDAYFREGGRQAYFVSYTAGAANVAPALAKFGKELGAGQVALAAETPTEVVYTALNAHALEFNRVALRDGVVGDTVTTLADLEDFSTTNEEYGATFGPWLTIPAPAGVVGGAARQVPASAVVAAFIARADALGNPNRAAAGRDFPAQYATGMVIPISDDDREDLLDVGVNTFAVKNGVLMNYGFQTSVAQSPDSPFWQFNCSRARMWVKARAAEVGEPYVFKPIDGKGKLARALQTDIDAALLELYNVDGLYGETPADAFTTEVGASVNTVNSIAQGYLNAVSECRFSLHAKAVQIALISVPVSGRVTQV